MAIVPTVAYVLLVVFALWSRALAYQARISDHTSNGNERRADYGGEGTGH
jgi:hypothetical protein